MVLSPDGRWLLVTNAGSGELSLFEITPDRLGWLTGPKPGGGPVSVTVHGSLVYTDNGTASISGFRLTAAAGGSGRSPGR